MKKVFLSIVMLIGINVVTKAQSGLCLDNQTSCDAYFAVYAELIGGTGGGGCPMTSTGCFAYRLDFKLKANSSVCFTDYDDAQKNSVAGWNGVGTILPPGLTCFHWVRAEMQQQNCLPTGGCGLAVGTCGTIPGGPGAGCTNTGTWTPGAVPGDINVAYIP